MRPVPFVVVAALAFAVSACSGGTLPVKQVYESEQCPQNKRGLYVAQNRPELLKLMTPRLKPTRIDLVNPQPSGLQSPGPQSQELQAKAIPPALDVEVNFDKEQAVVVALGQMPSPGYGISLDGADASLQDGVVNLPVKFSRPNPDALYAQVMTSPCLVLNLPKGDYTKVVAGDMTASVPKE